MMRRAGPARALVFRAAGTDYGVVLESEQRSGMEGFTCDFEIPQPLVGMSVFDGELWLDEPCSTTGEGDHDAEWRGTYRTLTDLEWLHLRETGRLFGDPQPATVEIEPGPRPGYGLTPLRGGQGYTAEMIDRDGRPLSGVGMTREEAAEAIERHIDIVLEHLGRIIGTRR